MILCTWCFDVREESDGEYKMDDYYRVTRGKKNVSKRRFVGYLYKNGIYIDNPGLQIKDRKTWEAWKKKKLID